MDGTYEVTEPNSSETVDEATARRPLSTSPAVAHDERQLVAGCLPQLQPPAPLSQGLFLIVALRRRTDHATRAECRSVSSRQHRRAGAIVRLAWDSWIHEWLRYPGQKPLMT